MSRPFHEDNRRSWNAATRAHNSHKIDPVTFFRGGGSTLFPEEIELLGDLDGARLVHLQCNAGQDTLSLARRGARVTGVDISDEAIDFASRLSRDTGIAATFVRADVLDWLADTTERFTVAFSSYGAYCWLADLDAWGRGIARVLEPGGRFVLVDFHPVSMMFDDQFAHTGPYSTHGAPITVDRGVRDYVACSGPALAPGGFAEGMRDFVNPHRAHEFAWGMADILGALLGAGLRLTALREYPHSNGARLFADMQEQPGRRLLPPARVPEFPLMFGLVAEKR